MNVASPKNQLAELMDKTGSEKYEDLLELYDVDFENAKLNPLLDRRRKNLQSCLFGKYWSMQNVDSDGEEDTVSVLEDAHSEVDADVGLEVARSDVSTAPDIQPNPRDVLVYVFQPVAPPPPPPPANGNPPGTERLCRAHRPTRNRRHLLEYWFFHAVSDGCQECVRILVNEMGVDVNSTSLTNGYNAMGFARHFNQPAMARFLQRFF